MASHKAQVTFGSELPVHHAWRVYGEPTVEVLETLDSEEAMHAAEIAAIAGCGTVCPGGYNICAGGDTAPSKCPEVAAKIAAKAKGRLHTEEVKAGISAELRERWLDPEYRAKVSDGLKAGWTPERRAALSEKTRARFAAKTPEERKMPEAVKEKLRGRIFSEETRTRMSAASKGKSKGPRSEEHRQSIASAVAKTWTDPETKAKRSAAIAAAWTPERRAAMAEKKRAYHAAKKAKP